MKTRSPFSLLAISFAMALPLSVSAQTTGAVAKPAAAAPVASAVAPTKLTLIERKVGDGALAENGSPVAVHYTGYLWDATAPDNKGKKFDSSIERKIPFGFMIGAGRVIKGWDEGVAGMKVGGQRTLIIPPDKGYGAQGAPGAIPPNATLVFDVELMSVVGKTPPGNAEASPYVPAKK